MVVVLADGTSDADRRNDRGHLFEVFVARLFELYGFEPPTTQSLNVTSDGIELDVVSTQVITGQFVIAECKAYSANVSADKLGEFYGKLAVRRLNKPRTFGVFVALPGLTQPANEQANTIRDGDPNFLLLTAAPIVDLLKSKRTIVDPGNVAGRLSDASVIITEHGVFSAAKELDPATQLPIAIRMWGVQSVPEAAIDLVTASDFAAGLPVSRLADALPLSAVVPWQEPTVAEVAGGTSDFEYQLPASPRFFVGRRNILGDLRDLLDRNGRAGRVLVINAQSGWGKSSLALRFKSSVESDGGLAAVLDSRTAAGPEFVWVALRHVAMKAQKSGILELPASASFASLRTCLQTLVEATWREPSRPVVLFFDQFENVFRDERITREFRDLALAVVDLPIPLVVAFAWKTDLLGWTEAHPYRLRDEIRDRATVVTVPPLGPADISTLLTRLERQVDAKLLPDLSHRLREYSQGLPWLFKKLASHVLRELNEGKSQEALLAEGLNVQRLFETDLAELLPIEQEALKTIARMAPVMVSEAVDLVDPSVVQSLLNRRLVVAVGERLDIYWDIFRDYLNTGRVPVQETYILRQTPPQVSRLLKLVIESGGDISVPDASVGLNTTEGVVFNAARDLRQMGVLVSSPGHVRIADDLLQASDREEAIRERIAQALRRHRAFSLLLSQMDKHGGEVTIGRYAEVLPEAFPAVQAKPPTWSIYARAFVHWFSYARLISKAGESIRAAGLPSQSPLELLGASRVTLRRGIFPHSTPGPAVTVLRWMIMHDVQLPSRPSAVKKALGDLAALGVLHIDDSRRILIDIPGLLTKDGAVDGPLLLALLHRVPGGAAAFDVLDQEPDATDLKVGSALASAQGTAWKESTAKLAGKFFRAWTRLARGEAPRRGRRRTGAQLALMPGLR